MYKKASFIDKGQLYNKLVYVYFCFFSMFVAERFSMNIFYGAALFFSLSALFRIYRFTVKTTYDSRLQKTFKAGLGVFFMLSTAYIIILYPFLFVYQNSVLAIIIIILMFAEASIENICLRRKAKQKMLAKRDIIKTILPIELFFIVIPSGLAYTAGFGLFKIVLIGTVIGMVFCFFRQLVFRDYAAEYPKAGSISKDAKQIRTVRLFDGMVITSGAALNIFAFMYILFIMFSRAGNFFLDYFVVFIGLALVLGALHFGTSKVIKSSLIQKIGKNAAFILGTATAIFSVYIFRESWFQSGFAISMQTILLFFGLTLQITATYGLKEDVFNVIKLYNKDIDKNALGKRTARLELWTAIISEAVILAVLLIIISNPLFYRMNVEEYIVYAPDIGSTVIIIPTIFLIISLVYSIKQPLTKKYEQKLKDYSDIKKAGKENVDMEKRLTNVLIKKYKKRIGVYIIRAFLKPIMYHTVVGKENVDALPGIFVFNHGEFYGPIAAVVFLPYHIRPWILNKMIDKEQITKHIYEGTFSKSRLLPKFLGKIIAKALSPIIVWALLSFEPIPVYRGTARDVIKTFSMSVECLSSGDSILLFPENPEEEYTEKISAFYKGFANLGKLYYKAKGKKVTFYPVHASRRKHILQIGEGVKYNPGNGRKERDRIILLLEQSMKKMQRIDDM